MKNYQRLENIDFLKGIGIILVVIGHFLSWTVCGGVEPLTLCSQEYLIRDIIYTFHMPLFFFLSGYVVDINRRDYDISYIKSFILKRILSIVLPTITCSIVYFFLFHIINIPWFCRTLFEVQLIYVVYRGFLQAFLKEKEALLMYSWIVIVPILYAVSLFTHNSIDNFIDIGNLRWYFIWFMIGWVYNRNNYLNIIAINEEKSKKNIASWSLLIFMVLIYFRFKLEIPPVLLFIIKVFTALFAIHTLLFLSLKISKNDITEWIICVGKASLFIYLYHELFLPRFNELGEFFITSETFVSIPSQICSALLFCFISILMTYFIERILNNFKLLRLVFLGKRN